MYETTIVDCRGQRHVYDAGADPGTVPGFATHVSTVRRSGRLGQWVHVTLRRKAGLNVLSLNRELEVLRRMLRLGVEWGGVEKILHRLPMLSGENQRQRVLSADEAMLYLKAANELGQNIEEEYQRALVGIRAIKRGQEPLKPDAFLLRDISAILLDCGLRPEECFRLRWSDIREGSMYIAHTLRNRAYGNSI